MNEKTKFIGAGLAVVLVILALAGTLWLLFGDIRTDPGTSDPVNERIQDLEREQQEAAGAIDEAIERAADSQGTAADLAGRIDHSQELTHSISIANDGAREGTGRAEAAIGEAAEAIDRAAGLADECEELIRSSESIFAKYDR
ncbi:hypothetical protein [Selenomonas sp. AB3002]|uniref:hypothetical protein n=1 Tax=Selenomonas sp. AB3002 TaxID=1392502 RepID=UPI00163A0F60